MQTSIISWCILSVTHYHQSFIYVAVAGVVAGGRANQKGATASLLCLPELSNYDVIEAGVQDSRPYIEGILYMVGNFPMWSPLHMRRVPCTLCRVPDRGVATVHPARNTCLGNWTLEYTGFMMGSATSQNHGTDSICVDADAEPQSPERSAYEGDGHGVMYGAISMTHTDCNPGDMTCPPYYEGQEILCAVCSV